MILENTVSLRNPVSQLCSQAQFEEPVFAFWMDELCIKPRYWRKYWEFAYIAQELKNSNLLEPGRKGLGFGVGIEPLPALFASYGVEVLATDGHTGGEWAETAQYSGGIGDLPFEGICNESEFRQRVTHRPVDMNDIPDDLRRGEFDFTWSTNSLDHLGTIDNGLDFIHASLDCLKPGGTAVHVTEYNLDSDNDTLFNGGVCLFRRRDMLRLVDDLRRNGHSIYITLERGNGDMDLAVDQPPYNFTDQDKPHIRLMIGGYTITSIGLIIKKAAT